MSNLVLYFVYGLTDPRLRGVAAVRYIGVTQDPNKRYQMHLACPQHDPREKNAWARSIQEEGLELGIEIFEVFKALKDDKKLALARETRWIRHYLSLGADLLNIQKNDFSSRKTVIIETSLDKDVEPILEAGRVFEDGTVIQQIDWDDFVSLFMERGAIGTSD